jgi:hypothetical protein
LFGVYTLNFANSDTAGVDSFPANPWDIAANYGRASFDVRNRLFMGGTFSLPYRFTLSPFIIASSGRPFSVTLGQDLYGTGIYNARPAYATASTPASDVRVTPYGTFDVSPSATGSIVPPNIGTGPSNFTVNMRISKTIGFGGERGRGSNAASGGGGGGGHEHGREREGLGGRGLGGGGGFNPFGGDASTNRQYNLTLSLGVRNLFNRVNLAPPIGVLSSRFFGQSIGLVENQPYNRRIDLQARFTF